MPKLYLVRHGEAESSWDEDDDPGLSDMGRAQARAIGDKMARLGKLKVVTSPLRRCRETADPVADLMITSPEIEPAVSEIPTPTDDLEKRGIWLREVFYKSWKDLEPEVQVWRDGVVPTLLALESDTIVVTHFVAINVAVGSATRNERVVCFKPDYCSITIMDSDGARLHVDELGREAPTLVR